jgi:hypothetical protein
MGADSKPLEVRLQNLLKTDLKMNGAVPPMTLVRWSPEDAAEALGEHTGRVRATLKELPPDTTGDRTQLHSGYHFRRHFDGRYSYSVRTPFEALMAPNPFELEALVDAGDFAQIDEQLADIGMSRPKTAGDAPELTWADGEPFSEGAADWYYGQLLANKFYMQTDESGTKRPVRNAEDVLRHALHPESARNLVDWLLDDSLTKASHKSIPRHPAALEHLAERVLDSDSELPTYALVGMMNAGSLGRRWLLRYGVIGAEHRLNNVHEAWPSEADVTGTEDEWRSRMQAFLERAVEIGARFSLADFREHYLSNPLFLPLLDKAKVEVRSDDDGDDPRYFIEAKYGKVDDNLAANRALRIVRLSGDDAVPEEVGEIPELPSEPMSVPEYNRRRKAANLTQMRTYHKEPYGYAKDPEGDFYAYPTAFGDGFGGRKLVRIERIHLKQGTRIVAKLEDDAEQGWDELDPVWKRIVTARLQTLTTPAALDVPDVAGGSFEVGSKVRITAGKSEGVEGEVFWLGPSKYDDSTRAGVMAAGKKHWVDAANLAPAGGGSEDGWTPLHAACDAYDSEVVAAILDRSDVWVGASSGSETRKSKYLNRPLLADTTPLHIAAAHGADDIVEMLLEHGADPMARDSFDNTPLHLVPDSSSDTRAVLLEGGADADAENQRGESAD